MGESTDLTVQVVNLGRGAGSAIVSETIPAGASASDFSLEPGIITDNADGSRTYTWAWKMGGAEDNGDLSQPTIYDRLDITYTLTWEAADCGGRSIGAAPRVDWSDSDGLSHISWGTELVVACCQ